MMSIGAALTAATTLVGHALPTGRAGEPLPVRNARDRETEEVQETLLEQATPSEQATLLVAIEAGLREAGYLVN